MGLRAGLDRCRKIRPPPGFYSRTAQPVASYCTPYVACVLQYFRGSSVKRVYYFSHSGVKTCSCEAAALVGPLDDELAWREVK